MKRLVYAPMALAFGLGLAPLAAAQATNFLTAPKIGCVPDTVTRCGDDGKCETRDASAKDKADVLIVDFAAKKASIRGAGKMQELGDVADEQVAGGERRFLLRPPGATDNARALKVTVTRAGKLTLAFDNDRQRAAATCAPEA